MKILITGASGFIGSFIVEEALRRGMETWAAVRRSSSREYLKSPDIHLIELDLSDQHQLEEQLRGKDFDYVVHAAGVTKCLNPDDFYRINCGGTQHLVGAIQAVGMPLKKFVYLSSLSVFGAIREQQPYEPIRESDTPQPNTDYGRSKLLAERFLDSLEFRVESVECRTESVEFATAIPSAQPADAVANSPLSTLHSKLSTLNSPLSTLNSPLSTQNSPFPYVILRPTGVYGPRERDYFLMAKSIKQHSDFAVGFQQQDITFVYVADVVQAVFLACERGKAGRKYFLSDGQVYQSTTFSDLIRRELGNPWWIRLTAPIWVLRVVTFFGDWIGHLTGKISALNNDKYHILRQRNWRCDIEPAVRELGYQPQYPLEKGVPLTIKWYKDHGWL